MREATYPWALILAFPLSIMSNTPVTGMGMRRPAITVTCDGAGYRRLARPEDGIADILLRRRFIIIGRLTTGITTGGMTAGKGSP